MPSTAFPGLELNAAEDFYDRQELGSGERFGKRVAEPAGEVVAQLLESRLRGAQIRHHQPQTRVGRREVFERGAAIRRLPDDKLSILQDSRVQAEQQRLVGHHQRGTPPVLWHAPD